MTDGKRYWSLFPPPIFIFGVAKVPCKGAKHIDKNIFVMFWGDFRNIFFKQNKEMYAEIVKTNKYLAKEGGQIVIPEMIIITKTGGSTGGQKLF